MTAAAESSTVTAQKSAPTEGQLLDVLYEVLAQGAPPRGELSIETVERFLHEHARSKKPVEEILAFFAKHGLPTDAAAYGADPALSELASGLRRDRGPISATYDLDAEMARVPAPSESGPMRRAEFTPVAQVLPSLAEMAAEDTAPRTNPAYAVPPSKTQRSWLPVVAVAAAAVFAVFAFVSAQRARDLEQKLNEARLQQRSTDVALTALEQRAETLRGALDQSESAREKLSGRFDDFVAREAQERAAESAALERILGRRFEALRNQALQQALATGTP